MNPPRRLVVSIDDQTLRVTQMDACLHVFPVSTAIKGMGGTKDSYRTPTGRFRICEKIGGDQASGTIFKARVPVGQWQAGHSPDADLVLTRILRLDGLDADNANTLERCVYIHGTNREDLIGEPAGHGCVRLRNADMIELFDMVSENDPVEILPATRRRGKLLFVTFESVLTALDGMRELARGRGGEAEEQLRVINAALGDGRMPAGEAYQIMMDFIRPDLWMCGEIAARCMAAMAPGAAAFMDDARSAGWLPVILSQGPALLVEPLAGALGIRHIEALPLHFHHDGSYAGTGDDGSPARHFTLSGVIRDWTRAVLPERVLMICHDMPDMESESAVNVFSRFTGSFGGLGDDGGFQLDS
ncbi:MAG: L,D-transpeptidase family protein [Luteolibacter sp.]|jgi:hypothetical protein|nr:L,D-transpeptidase family protein [Luteolibacter sp.]